MVRNQFGFFLPQREEVSKGDRDHEILGKKYIYIVRNQFGFFLPLLYMTQKGRSI